MIALAIPLLAAVLAVPAEPVVVQPDPAAADRVEVVGASPAEAEAARAALAAVPDSGLTRIRFVGTTLGRGLRMRGPAEDDTTADDPRPGWLPWVVAGLIGRALEGSGHPVRSAWDGRMGVALDPDSRPDRSEADLVADARALAARATDAGWAVSGLRVWPGGAGAVEVRLRLTERQVLDGRTDWQSTLYPEPIAFTELTVVEAPDGTVLTYGLLLTPTAGGGAFSTAVPEGHAPPPVEPNGRTRLAISVVRTDLGPQTRTSTHRYVLDCAGGPSSGLPDPPATCDRLVRDRYALLTPQASDTTCSGAPGGDDVALEGVVFGVAVSRGYDHCYGATTRRWADVLRVPARGSVAPRLPEAVVRDHVTGGTPRERRTARRAIAAVAGELPDLSVAITHQSGRRVIRVDPGQPARFTELTPADAAWLAQRVQQDLALRLQGDSPSAPDSLAVQARLAKLTSRATRAGWYVRVARAWPLRNGPYLVTIRLTERQVLDGRIDWEQVVAGPRPRHDAVRIAVEAPDGTLVAGGGMPFPRGDAPPPPGIDGPTRLTIDVGFGLGGSRHYVLDCDGGRSEGIADVAAMCARLVSDRYALLAPERDRCVAFGTTPSVRLTGTFRGVRIQRRQACVWQVVVRWRTLLGATSPALDPPTSP